MGYHSLKIKKDAHVILVVKRPKGYNNLGFQEFDLIKEQLPYYYYLRASKTSEVSSGDSNRKLEDIVTLYIPFNSDVQARDIIFIEDSEYQVDGHPQHFDNNRSIQFTVVNLFRTTS